MLLTERQQRERRAIQRAVMLDTLREDLVLREEEARQQLATCEEDRRAKTFHAYFYGRQTVLTQHETTRRHMLILRAMNKLDDLLRRHRVLTQGVRPRGATEPAGYQLRLCQAVEHKERQNTLSAESMIRSYLVAELRRLCPVMPQAHGVVPGARAASPQGFFTPRPPATRSYPNVDRRAETVYSQTLHLVIIPRQQRRRIERSASPPIKGTVTFPVYKRKA